MALAASGLQTQIWNNNLKSTLLLLCYPLLVLAMVWCTLALAQAQLLPDYGPGSLADRVQIPYEAVGAQFVTVAPYVIGAVLLWFCIAWFSHQSIIDGSTGAHSLSRREAPELYNLLENLCISRGLSMPKLNIIDTPALNAYASGISERSYAITVTSGLMQALDRDELEAVLAHELSHIQNRDVRLLIVSIIFVGIISFLCDLLFRWVWYGGGVRMSREDKGRGLPLIVAAVIVMAIGYVFAIVIRFALSRQREYLADAGAVALTRNPDAMIRALRKIEGHSSLGKVSGDVEQLFIDNTASSLAGVFATHPPISMRVAALVAMGGRDSDVAPTYIPADDKPQPTLNSGPWGQKSPRNRGPWG